MTATAIRVMLVDDHEVVRAGLEAVLARHSSIHIVAAVGSGAEALERFHLADPDVVILDHSLPDLTGSAVCRALLDHRPKVAVIILTSFDSDEVIHSCLAAGARGFLTKNVANGDLMAAVQAAARGEVFLAPEITERVIGWARQAKLLHQGDRTLTPEEIEVLGFVAQGLSNRQIAAELMVSESTVKLRLKQAMRKLGATRRLDAVAAGMKRGVI